MFSTKERYLMVRRICLALIVAAVSSFGSQGSGIFFDFHSSLGVRSGDELYHFRGAAMGSPVGDSIYYYSGGRQWADTNEFLNLILDNDKMQYSVRYSFLAGYEKSFTKVLSVRAAVGYQNVGMRAYAAEVPNFDKGDLSEVPFITAEISRHWLTFPIDLKVTLPIKRAGIYLCAGTKISYLLASEYRDSITGFTQDLGKATPGLNIGLGFRIGTELPVGNVGHVFLESGYTLGLSNLAFISRATTREGEIIPLGAGFRLNVPRVKDSPR
jgi:hypothetical protein